MRTTLENYLTSLVSDGRANYTSGDVEAPTGAFAVVTSAETFLELADEMESYGLDADEMQTIPLTHIFGVVEDAQGNVTVTDFGFYGYGSGDRITLNPEETAAFDWFDKLETRFTEWSLDDIEADLED